MDKIFHLRFDIVNSRREYGYKNVGMCYCSKCKTRFNSEKVKEVYEEINNSYTKYRSIIYADKKSAKIKALEIETIYCPNCNNSSTYKDLKEIETEYQLFNKFYVNDDKIKISCKYIMFNYYRERLVPVITHDMAVINMKTGHTYKFATSINGKLVKSQPRIKNNTYMPLHLPDYKPYSDKCVRLENIIPDIYNAIREYKINNNIVPGYIPTFEQNLEYYKLRSKEDNSFYKRLIALDQTSLCLFNRFPCLNIYDSEKLFIVSDYEFDTKKEEREYKNIRKNIKQDNNQVIKIILETCNIPYTKKNRQNLLKYGKDYLNIYDIFRDKISIDNFYKILYIYVNSPVAAKKLIEFIDVFNLTKQQFNNLCNKISKLGEYYNNIIIDLVHIAMQIKKDKPDYTLNLSMPLQNLHDIVSSDYNKLRRKNRVIDYNHLERQNNQFDFIKDGLKFKLAKDTHELIDVGSHMHICVGGYDYLALQHECYIVVARDKDNNPIVCIELDDKLSTIKQAKLKYNNIPDETIGKIVEEWAQKYNIDYANDRYRIESNKEIIVEEEVVL